MAIGQIVNFVKNLGIADFGSSNFMRTEDQFVTYVNADGSGASAKLTKQANCPQEVVIACKNKRRRVCGILNDGVKLSGESKWEELFGGGITALGGSMINMLNKSVQYTRGTSIQQPWMNRKFYNSTKPFSFSFQMNFISDSMYGGKDDVWEPTQALLSFVFPRQLSTAQKISDNLNESQVIDTKQTNSKGGKGVVAAGVDAIANEFAIPGPAIGWSENATSKGTWSKEDHFDGNGDAVTLVIGNLFAFGGVYIEKVDVEYSPNMDGYGYPLWAKCTVNVTVMDVNYCNTDGSFMISQFAEEQAALSSLVDSVNTLVNDVKEGMVNVAKTTIGGLKG